MRGIALVPLVLLAAVAASGGAAETNIPKSEGPNPWTHLNFRNTAEDFQFAIVSDRTGGMRPGVFERAVGKLNLLQPEFVMCVGDLVEGTSRDEAEYTAQRDEFDGILKPLQAPFFYVPGNHDVTNTPYGADIWKKRYGRLYYHFVYRDVLFVCMNSDDGGTDRIGDEQYDYVKKALEKSPKARWTFLFMHKPLWAMERVQGWDRVEKLLSARPHTVLAGHRHEYMKYDHNGRDYFVLATTGAGSRQRGPVAGEFDEIVWVTLTKDGPQFANLILDGIADKNVRTDASAKLADPLLNGRAISAAPFEAAGPKFENGSVEIHLSNPADTPLKAVGILDPSVQLLPNVTKIQRVIPPHGDERITVKLNAARALAVKDVQPLVTRWTLSYDTPDEGRIEVPFTLRLVVDAPLRWAKAPRPVKVDGALTEWSELPISCLEPAMVAPDLAEWTGPGDGSFRFSVTRDEKYLYVGVRVMDDRIESTPRLKSKKRDMVTVLVDARPESERKPATGPEAKEKPGYLTLSAGPGPDRGPAVVLDKDKLPEGAQMDAAARDGGYDAEFAIPAAYLDAQQGKAWRTVRVNIGVSDHDSLMDSGVTLWWRPVWAGDDGGMTGTFGRKG
ncbi:MAG: metallophosphoesterase [Candidatus Hydrogenedentes bacterium]|nr:metallophosphoesterase [Candidatus Hydrogenedentota bacterium]